MPYLFLELLMIGKISAICHCWTLRANSSTGLNHQRLPLSHPHKGRLYLTHLPYSLPLALLDSREQMPYKAIALPGL
jgi:hypothetical protein